LGYACASEMTRFTFVLLVCRAIGVISLVYLLMHCVYAVEEINWALGSRVYGVPAMPEFPYGMVAVGLLVPVPGLFLGLFAERMAASSSKGVAASQPTPLLTPLAVGVIVCAFRCIALSGSAQLHALVRWRYSPTTAAVYSQARFGSSGPPTGAMSLYAACAFALFFASLLHLAFRVTRGPQTT
jgi:hypothetical protein